MKLQKLILKNNLEKVRQSSGLSQNELDKMIGVSRGTIADIENEKFIPSTKLALVICYALNKKFEDLFYFE